MERFLDDNEKIRRAEEIAYRRNYIREKNLNDTKNKTYYGSKILLELLVILNIFVIVYAVQNKDEIFKDEFLAKILIDENSLKEKLNKVYKDFSEEDVFIENEKVEDSNNEEVENKQSDVQNNNVVESEEALGGSAEASDIVAQNESDTEKIKRLYSFELPLDGVVTSSFGMRESKNSKINGYHTGTDIAANMGTEIKSIINGKVSLVSNYGDYGKHLKIVDGDMEILYAHCKEILVNEGDEIKQGDVIAKVGSTGNSTGPHLHLEIIYQGRYINPQEIFDI